MMVAVAVVSGGEYFFGGEFDTPPPCPTLAESLHRSLSTRPIGRNGGH